MRHTSIESRPIVTIATQYNKVGPLIKISPSEGVGLWRAAPAP